MVQSSVSGVASHAVYMITTSALPNLMPLGTAFTYRWFGTHPVHNGQFSSQVSSHDQKSNLCRGLVAAQALFLQRVINLFPNTRSVPLPLRLL